MTSNAHAYVLRWPQSLPGRIIAGVLALAVVVAAFFFLFFVALAGAFAVAVLYLRALWQRRGRKDSPTGVIEGEYTVETSSTERLEEKSAGTRLPE
jgi:hypothetical protein